MLFSIQPVFYCNTCNTEGEFLPISIKIIRQMRANKASYVYFSITNTFTVCQICTQNEITESNY